MATILSSGTSYNIKYMGSNSVYKRWSNIMHIPESEISAYLLSSPGLSQHYLICSTLNLKSTPSTL